MAAHVGFKHVDSLHLYNSGSSVNWSLACWHSLNTYLHLLDPKQPLAARRSMPMAAEDCGDRAVARYGSAGKNRSGIIRSG
jgi:hypothetical protein